MANETGAELLHPRYRPGEFLPVYLEVAIDGTGPIGQLGGEAGDLESTLGKGGRGLLELFFGDIGKVGSGEVAELDMFPAKLPVGPYLAGKIFRAFIGYSRIKHPDYYGGAASPVLGFQ